MSYPPPGQQPYGQPYGQQPPGKVRLRGRIPLRLALLFGVIGVAAGIIGIVLLLRSPIAKIDDFPRVAADGQPHQVQLGRTGDYVVYVERPSGNSGLMPAGNLRIEQQGQAPVRVGSYDASTTLTYDVNDRHGRAFATFRIERAGTYTVTMAPISEQGSKIALGESIAHGIVVAVLLFVFGLLFVIAAVILLIVGLVRRGRHKRELESGYGYRY